MKTRGWKDVAWFIFGVTGLLLLNETSIFAAGVTTFSKMATTITGEFGQIAQLITAGSYIAGIGFSLGAVMKFKQHKDNPTQIPIGTPISMTFIAAALLFFPTILTMTGMSIFGTTTTAGTGGTAWGGAGS